jgi:hypothetical protein
MPVTALSGAWKGSSTVTALGSGSCTFPNATIAMTWTATNEGQLSVTETRTYSNFSSVGITWEGSVSNNYEVSMSHYELAPGCIDDPAPTLTLTGTVNLSGPKPTWKGTGTLDYCLPDCRFQVTYDLVKQ